MKYPFVLLVGALVLLLDQVTKWYVRQTVALYDSVEVIHSFFHITHVRNSGGAFSLFAGTNPAFRLPFFVIVCSVAIGVLLYFVSKVEPRQWLLLFALGGILGGALGNLTDRIVSGQVTDFLDVHWRGYYWPAFNVADSFISTGMVILLVHSLLTRDEPESGHA
jgi:signal peptidase II